MNMTSTETAIPATFTKLRSGAWGLRVERVDGYMPKPGDYVRTTTKAGDVAFKPVGRVMWNDDRIALCTLAA